MGLSGCSYGGIRGEPGRPDVQGAAAGSQSAAALTGTLLESDSSALVVDGIATSVHHLHSQAGSCRGYRSAPSLEPSPAACRGLARWVHTAVAHRLADGVGRYLRIWVEAPAEAPGTAAFPPS